MLFFFYYYYYYLTTHRTQKSDTIHTLIQHKHTKYRIKVTRIFVESDIVVSFLKNGENNLKKKLPPSIQMVSKQKRKRKGNGSPRRKKPKARALQQVVEAYLDGSNIPDTLVTNIKSHISKHARKISSVDSGND